MRAAEQVQSMKLTAATFVVLKLAHAFRYDRKKNRKVDGMNNTILNSNDNNNNNFPEMERK